MSYRSTYALPSEAGYSQLGLSITVIGDLDNDNIPEIAVLGEENYRRSLHTLFSNTGDQTREL